MPTPEPLSQYAAPSARLMEAQADKFDLIVALLTRPRGLAELALVLAFVYLGVLVSRWTRKRALAGNPQRLERLLPYLCQRIVLPLSAGLLCAAAAVINIRLFQQPHFGVLLIGTVLLFWMMVIRVATAVVRSVLPKGKIEQGTEHTLSAILWVGFISYMLGFDGALFEWLDSVSFHIGKNRLTLFMIVNALIWVSVVVFVALWVSRIIDSRMMKLSHLDLSFRIVISKIIRTGLMVAAVLIALPIVGIDLTVLSVFSGALGVGLGFGLQKIASNYVSGFIILLERSVRIGDRIVVDNRTGVIREITSRYLVLRQSDGTEALIPNDTMIANTVVNTSYSDRAIWVSQDVGVAYDTDLELAMQLMIEAAQEAPRVMKDPGPGAYVIAFGDSSITLTVGYWIGDPENGSFGPKSAINLGIWRKFKANGIEMPFPQREVRVIGELAVAPQPAPPRTEASDESK